MRMFGLARRVLRPNAQEPGRAARRRTGRDAGHEAVGQALLVTVIGMSAVGAAALGRMIIGNLEALMTTLTTLTALT